MGRGALFPPSMNGPLGYQNRPLPYDEQSPTLFNDPKYNAPLYNGPYYNQPIIKSVSGFSMSGSLPNP
jgi:hypothetical protein